MHSGDVPSCIPFPFIFIIHFTHSSFIVVYYMLVLGDDDDQTISSPRPKYTKYRHRSDNHSTTCFRCLTKVKFFVDRINYDNHGRWRKERFHKIEDISIMHVCCFLCDARATWCRVAFWGTSFVCLLTKGRGQTERICIYSLVNFNQTGTNFLYYALASIVEAHCGQYR